MLTLLFWAIVLGVLAWILSATPLPQPWRNIALGLLVLVFVVVAFNVFGVGPGVSLR